VKQTAAKMWGNTAGLRAAIRGGAERVSSEVGDRLQRASVALDEPEGAEIDNLYSSADLPELEREDPIASLAQRLDGESDLFRNLALRALTRAGWADRIAQGAAVLTGLGAAALAVIAGIGALFGADGSLARVILIATSVGVLSVGAAVVSWISGSIRRAQRELARDAFARADLAELRLHRIGVVTALLQMDEPAGRQALARLERDVSAPPR
jgi:hypothetical protein